MPVDSTLVVDFGTFYLNSALESESKGGQLFKLGVSEVTTYLVNEHFAWSMVDGSFDDGMAPLSTTTDGDPQILPILDRMGFDVDVQFHNLPGSCLPYRCPYHRMMMV